jgi:hypothetical protein
VAPVQANPRRQAKAKKPRCQDCFFHQNKLCALGLTEACPTFRPAHPDGLRPPQQLTFVFRAQSPARPLDAVAAEDQHVAVTG